MPYFISFFYINFHQVKSHGDFCLWKIEQMFHPTPRYVKLKKKQLEGNNFKDLNSHEYQEEERRLYLLLWSTWKISRDD